MMSFDVAGEILGDLDLSAGGGPGAIGGHRHKVHGAGQVNAAAQVRHKDEGAPQDADQDDLPPLIVLGNLVSQLSHPASQLLLGEQNLLDVFL